MPENKDAPHPFSDWIRLQTDFQARLTDETFRYLRRLQGAVAPVTPGTVLLPEEGTDLRAVAAPGGTFEITLEVKNDQRVHAASVPALDPLVSATGVTWYPDVRFSPEFSLVAPEATIQFLISVSVPQGLPEATYVGVLSLRGLRQHTFRLSVEIHKPGAKAAAPRTGQRSGRQAANRTNSARPNRRASGTARKSSRKASES
jgi:hypothetical protein